MSLGGRSNVDITTTWPSEIYHKFTKRFDIPWKPRVDVFIGESDRIARECDALLLYEIKHKQHKDRQTMDDSKWGTKSKMKGSSTQSDKSMYQRFIALLGKVESRRLKPITWRTVCEEANNMLYNGDKEIGKLHPVDGTNFTKYQAFRNDKVRGRFTVWLNCAEKHYQRSNEC